MSQKITKEAALESVRRDAKSLRNLPIEFQNDKEVVLEAVKQDGLVLQYASKELRNDLATIYAAMKQNGNALQFASEEIQNSVAGGMRVRQMMAAVEREEDKNEERRTRMMTSMLAAEGLKLVTFKEFVMDEPNMLTSERFKQLRESGDKSDTNLLNFLYKNAPYQTPWHIKLFLMTLALIGVAAVFVYGLGIPILWLQRYLERSEQRQMEASLIKKAALIKSAAKTISDV